MNILLGVICFLAFVYITVLTIQLYRLIDVVMHRLDNQNSNNYTDKICPDPEIEESDFDEPMAVTQEQLKTLVKKGYDAGLRRSS